MLGKLLSKIVGDPNDKVLKRLEPMVAEINALEPKYEAMHDDDLSAVTYELKGRFKEGLLKKVVSESILQQARVTQRSARSARVWSAMAEDRGFVIVKNPAKGDSAKAGKEDDGRNADEEIERLLAESANLKAVANRLDADSDKLENEEKDLEDAAKRLDADAKRLDTGEARLEADLKERELRAVSLETESARLDARAARLDSEAAARSAEIQLAKRDERPEIESNSLEEEAREAGKRAAEIRSDATRLEAEGRSLEAEGMRLEAEATTSIGTAMDDVLPDAFAAIREASRRVLGMRPFDVQLMGAITLHEGKIAEMRTGEGKTLVATLPAYLSAVAGWQVHIVTVNDYLAKRDAAWMGAMYSFMGLTVGCIQQDGVSLLYDELHTTGDGTDNDHDATGKFALNPDRHLKIAASRRDVYDCDIVYGTNNEFGFDYLRGNIALNLEEMYQRKRHFAIVDEVDNILIDEARTPLIISGPSMEHGRDYNRFAGVGARMVRDEDFEIDEQRKSVSITESGIDKAEKQLGMRDIYGESNDQEVPHMLENAIRAQHLYHRDREYVLRDDEVVLVDEFTGRLMEGRRLSDGLHQAIEAKEKLRVREETRTYASITLQNYFKVYDRLSGMTGTASTEAEELLKIYGLEVTTIPTNREDLRIDHQDLIYMTEDAKWRALAIKIESLHREGRPILVGTTTIEKSQIISDILKKRGIRHQVLNAHASRHQSESEIIAQAGVAGTVTVATNMAGRGTDIILGGNPELIQSKAIRPVDSRSNKSRKNVRSRTVDKGDDKGSAVVLEESESAAGDIWRVQHDAVVDSGGLFVLGTERHESRRIDNQLRGRAARQGDPGETQFFLSAEDDLVRRFGGDRIKSTLGMFNWDEDTPVENAMLVKSVENAQQKVEGINFEIRKQLVEYDDVGNEQRKDVYRTRDRILTGMDFREEILGYIIDALSRAVGVYLEGDDPTAWDIRGLQSEIRRYFPIANILTSESDFEGKDQIDIESELHRYARSTYEQRVLEFSDETMQTLERSIMLRVLDRAWVGHLTRMENMRQGIGLQAIGQRDPLVQYRAMSFQLYEQMNQEIRDEVARTILNIAPGLGLLAQQDSNGQLVANQSDGRAIMQRLAVAQAARQQSVMAGAQQQPRSSGNGAPVRAPDGRRLSRRERRLMEREQKRRGKAGSS